MKFYKYFIVSFAKLTYRDPRKILQTREKIMAHEELFTKLLGKWQGTAKTWFEADVLADETSLSGEFVKVINENFLRHTYNASMQGKPRSGEDLIASNTVSKKY